MKPLHESVQQSFVEVPANSDFSIHNIPFGILQTRETHACTAIGEYVVDLHILHDSGFFPSLNLPRGIFAQSSLNAFFRLGRHTISAVRARLQEILSNTNEELRNNQEVLSRVMMKQKDVSMLLPVAVGNYTDFYSSEEHARNVGSMFRDPQNALLPNWKHLPVAYHGRASSIVASGTNLHRPKGQIKTAEDRPVFSPTQKLDFEVETAFITCRDTTLGHPVPISHAEDCIAGVVLFNDWSARDIQQWEYAPLGPFLGKNFGSSVSPWVVTIDALEPFRTDGPVQDPSVLPYLGFTGRRNFDVQLETCIQTPTSGEIVVCRTNMKYLYWNMAQQLAHHTVNGCNIQVGDIYASGTISGPSPGSYGSLLELTRNGKKSLALPDGTLRTFLEDNDTVIMRGYAEKGNMRVGFGECRGTILPAL